MSHALGEWLRLLTLMAQRPLKLEQRPLPILVAGLHWPSAKCSTIQNCICKVESGCQRWAKISCVRYLFAARGCFLRVVVEASTMTWHDAIRSVSSSLLILVLFIHLFHLFNFIAISTIHCRCSQFLLSCIHEPGVHCNRTSDPASRSPVRNPQIQRQRVGST